MPKGIEMPNEIKISDTLVKKAVRDYLNSLKITKKGHAIALMNLSMDGVFRKLPKGKPTQTNLVIMLAREVAKKMNLHPREKKNRI